MSFWLVAAKQEATPESIMLQSWIAKPGLDTRDFSTAKSKGEVKRSIKDSDETLPPESLEMQAQAIWHFVFNIDVEDVMCVVWFTEGKPQGICFAEVIGKCYAEPLAGGAFEHRVPIRWYKEQAGKVRLRPYIPELMKANTWPEQINNKRFNQALRNYLPLPGNKFVKWTWLIMLLLLIKVFMLTSGMWRRMFGMD